MESSSPVRVKDPLSDQHVNTLQMNWQPGERTLVFLPPFNNKIEEGPTHYRIQELARQTGVPTLALDHPGMGNSDALTEEQKASFKSGDGYKAVAETQLRIMKELGITDIDLAGQSMGAYAAAEIARYAAENYETYGIKVHNLIAVEMTGVEDFSLLGIGGKFGAEAKYLDLYTENPHDPRQLESSGGPLTIKDKVKIGVDSVKPDALRYTNAMRKKSAYDTLSMALSANPDLQVTTVNGTISGISPAEGNKELSARLKAGGFGDRAKRYVFPGEPHTVMESAKRFGGLVTRIINPATK